MSEVVSLYPKVEAECLTDIAVAEATIEERRYRLSRMAMIYSGQLTLDFEDKPEFGEVSFFPGCL